MEKTQTYIGNIIQKTGEEKLWKISKMFKDKATLRELKTMIPKTVSIERLEKDYEQWI